MNNRIAIAGIHTGIGKTIVSAVIAEAIGADYWKPVQAGLEERDILTVKKLITKGTKRVHGEVILLSRPLSPHTAAAIDEVEIDHTKFVFPHTDKVLLIETAGGVLSPISDSATVADFIAFYRLPAILVAQNYLGSINHTLLSIEALKSRGIPVLGLILNGEENESSETFIEQYAQVPVIARIPTAEVVDADFIIYCAGQIKGSLLQTLGNGDINPEIM